MTSLLWMSHWSTNGTANNTLHSKEGGQAPPISSTPTLQTMPQWRSIFLESAKAKSPPPSTHLTQIAVPNVSQGSMFPHVQSLSSRSSPRNHRLQKARINKQENARRSDMFGKRARRASTIYRISPCCHHVTRGSPFHHQDS